MILLRRLCAVLILALMPQLAQAESRILLDYKNWKVGVHLYDGEIFCLATSSYSGNNLIFGIMIHPFEQPLVLFKWKGMFIGESQGQMIIPLQVDQRRPWKLYQGDTFKDMASFTLDDYEAGTRFLIDLASGSNMRVLNNEGYPLWNVSLHGSRAALSKLSECRRMIESN